MNLQQLQSLLQRFGVTGIYAKPLAENDNSKQQIYLGSGFSALSILPIHDPKTDLSTKNAQIKAKINLYWVDLQGRSEQATHTQLILYPQYPEVRLSGFLKGCSLAPNEHLRPLAVRQHNNDPDRRVLFFGVNDRQEVYCFLATANTELSDEFFALKDTFKQQGVFFNISTTDIKMQLLAELSRIHRLDWIAGQRLGANGVLLPYTASNGGGYTLEAELGIIPNGNSAPDFLGWEIKGYSQRELTLMTPEPTGGEYRTLGIPAFLRMYGLPKLTDTSVIYLTGPYHAHKPSKNKANRQLQLKGFDPKTGKIDLVTGSVQLIQPAPSADIVLAEWDYSKLLDHWSKKHNQAAYVPYLAEKISTGIRYKYNSPVYLGEGTDFGKFLRAIQDGKIYYDPGIKLETQPTDKIKPRSQFRVKFKDLTDLYNTFNPYIL